MSRAFVKEDVDPPERSGRKRSASGLPPGATNYITARGAKHLRDELQKLHAANANGKRVAELEQILASVHVVDPSDPPSNSVASGATVTAKDKKGQTRVALPPRTLQPFERPILVTSIAINLGNLIRSCFALVCG